MEISRCFKILICMFCLVLASSISIKAQDSAARIVSGIVSDDSGEPIPGATVVAVGTQTGTLTDFDGNFELSIPASVTELRFSFIGFESATLSVSEQVMKVILKSSAELLDDVVVVGYGVQRKSDLTGSVSSVTADDFNEGLISSPEQLISGKVSGVQIISNSGSPTSGSTIRIRGGASLNASNDPLIVVDGLPLESGGVSGNEGNLLSLINPNDIESMVILKDAASTAIYGSRGSNGVVLITTKKGSAGGLKISLSSTNSLQVVSETPEMLTRSQFVEEVNRRGTSNQKALLGTANTDWNDEVYQLAFGTDNNISLSSSVWGATPLRFSLGYYNQDGVLKTDNAERMTGSLSLSPSFFDQHLKINLNAKGAINNNTFANTSAIWAANSFNPTVPVYSDNGTYGGYNQVVDGYGNPVNGAVVNPLSLLEQNDSRSTVKRIIGNADFDYKFHFLPELRWKTTFGYDYASGQGDVYIPNEAYELYTSKGRSYSYGPQENVNRLLTTYLNYNKYLESINSSIEGTLGYDYQYWKNQRPSYDETNTVGEIQAQFAAMDQRHVLLSYYARLNYTFDSKYILTASMRRDGTSRFAKDNRWGNFPSLALAWRMSEEKFLVENQTLSTLKLRVSYGITGQQEGIGNYNYLPVYTLGQDGTQMQYGNNWIYTYRPEAYVADLKWETTKSWNAGFDFGLFKDKITGSFDVYNRKTEDLLSTVPSAAGTNFDKTILTNVGNVNSQGVEFSVNANPINKTDWNWDVTLNMSWQKMKVENLSLIEGATTTNTSVGPYVDGYQLQTLTEGYEPYMFYVYKQLYDEATGRPIEGAYADLNGDGLINTDDLYRYKSPTPDFIAGFSTSLNYKKWSLSTTLRANIGNYVYNGTAMNTGAWNTVSYNSYQLNNLSSSYLETNFASRQHLSDYYVENASFLRMDNLILGCNLGKIAPKVNLNLTGMIQNVFTTTKYTGTDPEVLGGIESSFYPRPRIFSLGIGVNFN